MERIRWEGQNFFEVVTPQEEDKSEMCAPLQYWLNFRNPFLYSDILVIILKIFFFAEIIFYTCPFMRSEDCTIV
jgi:hypothetical protein